MTLKEISACYTRDAQMLSAALRPLRERYRLSRDSEERFFLSQKIQLLTQVLTQTKELAVLTEHYYERGVWRNEKYTL